MRFFATEYDFVPPASDAQRSFQLEKVVVELAFVSHFLESVFGVKPISALIVIPESTGKECLGTSDLKNPGVVYHDLYAVGRQHIQVFNQITMQRNNANRMPINQHIKLHSGIQKAAESPDITIPLWRSSRPQISLPKPPVFVMKAGSFDICLLRCGFTHKLHKINHHSVAMAFSVLSFLCLCLAEGSLGSNGCQSVSKLHKQRTEETDLLRCSSAGHGVCQRGDCRCQIAGIHIRSPLFPRICALRARGNGNLRWFIFPCIFQPFPRYDHGAVPAPRSG